MRYKSIERAGPDIRTGGAVVPLRDIPAGGRAFSLGRRYVIIDNAPS
jgi:hypothetical protein